MDKYFRVEVIASTPNPQQVVYAAMHSDYSENFVFDEELPEESKAGDLIVKHLLSGHKGHYGPLEHPQITFNCGWFPHSVMQQARTHRVGISFDVQSFRYTGKRILDYVDKKKDWEEVFYLRPVGFYKDRQGNDQEYTDEMRYQDWQCLYKSACYYVGRVKKGLPPEHARSVLPFDVRQHFVVSFNLRSLMHFLQIRGKKDAQLEIQQLCELMLPHFQTWCPEIYEWFKNNLWLKGRLAP